MRDDHHTFPHQRRITFLIFTCLIFFTLGCNLFSANYWIHRLDDNESNQVSETKSTATTMNAGSLADSNFGSKCLTSPGAEPCPIDACIVYEDQYTAKNMITSELFGKANPGDYQCCAEFQFTNNSGADLMIFEHHVTEYADNWIFQLHSVENPEQPENCTNYFTRNDGKETLSMGVTEIVVLYVNPHCDWIQWDEPRLDKFRVPVAAGCYPNN